MKKLIFLTLLTAFFFLNSETQAQTRGWGYNLNGALAIGNSSNQPSPQTVTLLPDATGNGGGVEHNLFLRADGTLAVAGLNDFGQFGSELPASSNVPLAVPGLTNVVQASAGAFHSVALLEGGAVWAWGYNLDGQVGNGTTSTTGCSCVTAPTQTTITDVVQIEAGSFHTLALKSDGTVWAWGYNLNGQLGDNSTTDRSLPVQVGAGVAGFTGIIAISAGDNHSLALKSDGTVWVWGSNEYGQIGNGAASPTNQLVPVQNTTLSGIAQISAGILHSVALNTAGKVFVWGDNFYGQVGNGAANDTPQATPVQNTTINTAIEIDTAGFTNYARLPDGRVLAWGYNFDGQIGNGTTNTADCECAPTPVETQIGAGNTGIGAAWFHAVARKPVIAVGTGTNQTLRGDNLRLTFADITGAGNVSYTAVDPAAISGSYSLPLGYTIQNDQPAYDVTTSAATAGSIDVCITGINEFNSSVFASLRIMHGEGANWVDRTQSSSFINRQICARVTTLSPFVIATAPAATAANVSVSGRVVNGKTGIARAIVTVTDSTGTTRSARTNSFGVYRFEALPAGQTYTFNVTAKGYQFAPQVVMLSEDLAGFDLEAIE